MTILTKLECHRRKNWDFGGIGYLQKASIRCYKRGNMWSIWRFLKWSRNSWPGSCGRGHSATEHALDSKVPTALKSSCGVTSMKSVPLFPRLQGDCEHLWQRALSCPAAHHTEMETKVGCTKMRPRRVGSAYWRVTRGWKLWRRRSDSSTLTAEVTGFSSYQTEFLLGSPRALGDLLSPPPFPNKKEGIQIRNRGLTTAWASLFHAQLTNRECS